MSYLTDICRYKQEELEAQQRKLSLRDVRFQAQDAEPARNFYQAVTAERLDTPSIIAEVKKASPSRGLIVSDFDPVRIAHVYEENGAAALSVLTDEHFFQGRLQDISAVKKHVGLPVLRKDFTLHEYPIYEARAGEADAILLIAAILEADQLADYRDLATELGMTVLIEVHDQEELEKVLRDPMSEKFKHCLIGINNRNLKTFATDLSVAETLRSAVPVELPVVAESGIQEREDIERLKQAGLNIFLIGEALLAADDIGEKLRSLLGR